MSDCLAVLNPRAIPDCLDAIEALPIDKAYITGYSEHQLMVPFARVLDESDYDRFLVIADDVIPATSGLEAVVALLDEHPVVTGYCTLDSTDRRVNLCKSPLGDQHPPGLESYDFYTREEVDGLTRSWFAGMCLTGMHRDLWRKFPFKTYFETGGQSDFHLSYRLQEADIPIIAPEEGYCVHVKERWNYPDLDPIKRLRIGEIPPQVSFGDVSPLRAAVC